MKTNFPIWVKRFQIPLFFVLTLATSWAVWIPAAVAKLQGATSVWAPEGLIGGTARWLPGLVAILLSFLIFGRTGIRRLFQPLRIWRVGLFWYIFALFFQMVVFFAGKIIDLLLGRLYEVTSPLSSVYGSQAALMAPMVILFAFPGAFAEELGWRGFALPSLQEKMNALLSSITIAIFWGAWHIPLLIYFGELSAGNILGYITAVAGFIPVAIIYTWIYNNTKRSLLLVTLFHLGQQLSNNFLGVLPSQTDDLLCWIVALVIILVEGVEHFSRQMSSNQKKKAST